MKKGNENKAEMKFVKKVEKTTNEKNLRKNKHYVAEKKNTEAKKEKKENIFKRVIKYFKGVGKEIKRIRWTERKDLVKYSICTLLFVVLFGVYFYAIDWLVLLVRSLAK